VINASSVLRQCCLRLTDLRLDCDSERGNCGVSKIVVAKAAGLAAFLATALLQSQFVVLTEAAHLLNHYQGKLTYHQAACSQQIRAFKVCAIDVLHASINHEARCQYGHEQNARSANY